MNQYRLMARFNAWANERLFATVAGLGEAAYRADSGLFFGSIHATLNHLLVVDLSITHIWSDLELSDTRTCVG